MSGKWPFLKRFLLSKPPFPESQNLWFLGHRREAIHYSISHMEVSKVLKPNSLLHFPFLFLVSYPPPTAQVYFSLWASLSMSVKLMPLCGSILVLLMQGEGGSQFWYFNKNLEWSIRNILLIIFRLIFKPNENIESNWRILDYERPIQALTENHFRNKKLSCPLVSFIVILPEASRGKNQFC